MSDGPMSSKVAVMVPDIPLFDVPGVKPLPRAKTISGAGPIKYSSYRVKGRVQCQDCVELNYDALMAKRLDAPPIRQAMFKRRQGDTERPLCGEHKAQREQDEYLVETRAKKRHA